MNYHCGTEKTRDELRKQVYDAMAEEEKTEAGKENGVAESPVKHVNGSEEPQSSVQVADVNGEEKSPGAPVNGVKESLTPGKETMNGEKTEATQEDSKDEEAKTDAEQGDEEPEGS